MGKYRKAKKRDHIYALAPAVHAEQKRKHEQRLKTEGMVVRNLTIHDHPATEFVCNDGCEKLKGNEKPGKGIAYS